MLTVAALPAGAAEDVESLRDPTRPLNFMPGEESTGTLIEGLENVFSSFRLNSVLIRDQDRIAVINDQRVRVGDQVGRATVTGIDNTRVVLDVDGEARVLELYGAPVKTLVAGERND